MENKTSKPRHPKGLSRQRPCHLLWLLALMLSSFVSIEASAAGNYDIDLHNVTFKAATKVIEEKTPYSFVYESEIINEKSIVNISVEKGGIDDILKQLLKGMQLKYAIKGNRIYLAADSERPASNTPIKVEGTVTDENGIPLIGATVGIADANIYVATDADGRYHLSLPGQYANSQIDVSYVGYKNASKPAQGGGNIDFALEESALALSDVVVVGYGTQKRETLTNAISTVGSTDLERSAAVNTSGALVGKVAGINARQTDGRPGATTTLNIRNMGTPLYVVDGVQVDEGQFNQIDFNDIESISVLKDASAAIYGVKAANGVVVVTTKSGKRNTPNQVNINAYYGWQQMLRFPKPADASTWVEALVQSATIKGTTGRFSYEDLQNYRNGTLQGFDWYDYIFTTAPQYYLSASTQGGSDRINYYFSVSRLNQESIVNNFGNFERTNIQVNVNANITDNFKIGAQINGRIENTDHAAVSNNDGNDDYWSALFANYRNDPVTGPYANNNPLYPQLTSSAVYTNFALMGKTGWQKDRWKVLQANFNAEWEVIKNLKIKGLFSYYFATRRYDNQENSFQLWSYNPNTDTYAVSNDITSRWKDRTITNIENINAQISASYEFNIDKLHNFSIFAGAESYKYKSPGFTVSSNPLANSLNLFYFDTLRSFSDTGDNTQTRIGIMGRFNYDYASRYLFEFAARYDGSWKFPPNHRWGFFPSVSGGWRISQEAFWNEDLKRIVSDLKIRASYGVMGDDNVSGYGNFDYLSGYNYGSGGAVLNGAWVLGSAVRSLPVTNLSWMKSKVADVGFDIGLLNNRLTGSLDLFRRLRTGWPAARYDVVLPTEIGFTLPNENLNSDLQKGIDGMLSWQDKVGDFSYRVGGNFTLSRSYNWHQYKPRFTNSRDYYVYSTNERVAGAGWAYRYIGQFQSWEQIANYPVDIDGRGNTTLRPGDLIYADLNNDGMITGEDQEAVAYQSYESANTPILSFGFTLGFEWKGIDFTADFSGAAKQSLWFNYEQRTPFWGEGNSPQYYLEDMWHLSDITNPDSELIPGTFPTALEGNTTHSNYWASSFWMTNVRYLKLRNLEIGYTFPQKWTKPAHISKLRVYTLMQNLFSIDNVHSRGMDPEICQGAGFAYPTNRVITLGVNVTF